MNFHLEIEKDKILNIPILPYSLASFELGGQNY